MCTLASFPSVRRDASRSTSGANDEAFFGTRRPRGVAGWLILAHGLLWVCSASAAGLPADPYERTFEWTVESRKEYADPFNDIEIDVIFRNGGRSWRVPAFWRGGQKWSVRFSPPIYGEFSYHVESSDGTNSELNGIVGRVSVVPYAGSNPLLQGGALRVSESGRHLENGDGTPFFWLGDTWWMGLSGRLNWEGFQTLVEDRKKKGFTLVQLVAGFVPLEESPSDPGLCNEGGCVWDPEFNRINPAYFDYADRRIQLLVDKGLVPAIVGGWNWWLPRIGVHKMQKHWRYIVARYGAYPVLWILGGEVIDPPDEVAERIPQSWQWLVARGWTQVAQYVRAIDPYNHPMTAHEWIPPVDVPLQDNSLTDFDLLQSGQSGDASLASSIAQLNLRRARLSPKKPVVQGEIGYEAHHYRHYADYQRASFWLAMLNGAAGYTYGAEAIWGAYGGDQPLLRTQTSFMTWTEGMNLPGSYQVGISSRLLRRYRWWLFEPRPEWITPQGTTLLGPRERLLGNELGSWMEPKVGASDSPQKLDFPAGEWKARGGNARLPYAAGIPNEVRFVYIPERSPIPTILGLESGVSYHAYLWQPEFGIEFDLGIIERPSLGEILRSESFAAGSWVEYGKDTSVRTGGAVSARDDVLLILQGITRTDLVASVEAVGHSEAALISRYQDPDNYVAVVYSPEEGQLHLLERRNGVDSEPIGGVKIKRLPSRIQLTAEFRGHKAMASVIADGTTYDTPIVDLQLNKAGRVGLRHERSGSKQVFDNFVLRECPTLPAEISLRRALHDAEGNKRGELVGGELGIGGERGSSWDSFGRDKHILLDAYQPGRLPTAGDWVLVLDATDQSTFTSRTGRESHRSERSN